jgi:uncharacterized membrane protein HdeD (DUF308 family)
MFGLQHISRRGLALRGLLAAAVGAVCVIWPGVTIGVIVVLFAIYCFSDAIAVFASVFQSGETAGRRLLMLVVGAIDVAAGVVAIAYPGITAEVLVIVVGVWAIFAGGLEIAAAFRWVGSGRGWLGVGGVLSVATGVLLVVWPGIGAFTIALVFGIYLLVFGVTMFAAAVFAPRGESFGEAFA